MNDRQPHVLLVWKGRYYRSYDARQPAAGAVKDSAGNRYVSLGPVWLSGDSDRTAHLQLSFTMPVPAAGQAPGSTTAVVNGQSQAFGAAPRR